MTRSKALQGFAAIDIGAIHPHPGNPRTTLTDLEDLADSIKAQGILEPLIVMEHPDGEGRYQLLAGHRRLAAAELAGKATVPCIIRTGKTPGEALEFALVENGQRKDLDPIDEARAIKQLMKVSHMTQREVAVRMGRAPSHIANRLALLTLTPSMQQQVKTKQITVDAANKKARVRKGSVGTKPWMENHFGMNHPLASEARHQHNISHNGGGARKIDGNQACGACWEKVLRRDERRQLREAAQA